MKVKNLYIGDIYIISKAIKKDYFGKNYEYESEKICRTLVEEFDSPRGMYYKDIINGGSYHSFVSHMEVGDKYVTNLSQNELDSKLETYNHNRISKRKLVKYLKGNK